MRYRIEYADGRCCNFVNNRKDLLDWLKALKDEKIVEKRILKLPKQITNVIKCKNPRCITSIEQGLDQVFILADPEKEVYRCKYCEEKYSGKRNK